MFGGGGGKDGLNGIVFQQQIFLLGRPAHLVEVV